MVGEVDLLICGWIDGWMDGWMDGWVGWLGSLIDRFVDLLVFD